LENLQLSYPGYFLIIITVVAVIYTLSLYLRDKRIKENKTWLPYVLSLLRFLAILGILFLLLTPLFKRFVTEKQKPVIVLLNDESASIKAATDAQTLESVNDGLASVMTDLSEDFEIVELPFAERLAVSSEDTINDQSTNISTALEYVSETFEDQNLGAIILTTDGIYNEGKNPLYADMQLSVPLYTVPLGDTTTRKDIFIKNVIHNRIVYLNDKFLIETDIQAYNAKGTSNQVALYKVNGKKRTKVGSKNFTIDKDNFFKSVEFELSADQVGNVKYAISVNKIANEVSTANNSRNTYLEVLDARQKILLMADAPHPDIKAIKRALNSNKNYELDVKLASGELPALQAYDVIILHNLPSSKHKSTALLDQINKLSKPVLYILGGKTEVITFNSYQEVLKISGSNNSVNEITPIVSAQFDLFTMPEELGMELSKYLPLKVPFGEYKVAATSETLLYQKIGNVETKYPLLAFSDIKNHKQAVLAGEGLWRWQLYEHQEYEEMRYSSPLLLKTIQYITQKKDKRQFRAFVSKNSFKENESISFDAQLYNENYEAINGPEAQLTIKNAAGDKFDYTFSKSANSYYIGAGKFPEGNYTFSATTKYNGKDLSATGKFNVQSILKEAYDLTARHDLLFDLANKHGGQAIYPSQLASLQSIITDNDKIKPILFQKAETTPVLDLWWLLPLLIAFLIIEWFLRRYFGGY